MLEIHLRYVRSFLEDASRKVPPELGIDFEGVLQKISSVPHGSNLVVSPSTVLPMIEDSVQGDASFRPQSPDLSHATFLISVLERVEGHTADGNSHGLADKLFNVSLKGLKSSGATSLPPKDEVDGLIDNVFAVKHPMLAFLHEQYFRDTVELVYTAATRDEAIDRFLPMLHMALALGYLFSSKAHRAGCSTAQQKAVNHYLAGQNLLQPLQMTSMIALQSLLCSIVWLVSTCRTAQAHPQVGLAVSLALRLGIHTSSGSLPLEERLLRARVFAAVSYIDMYVSMLLDAPRCLSQVENRSGCHKELALQAATGVKPHISAMLHHLSLLNACVSEADSEAHERAANSLSFEKLQAVREWKEKIGSLSQIRGVSQQEERYLSFFPCQAWLTRPGCASSWRSCTTSSSYT